MIDLLVEFSPAIALCIVGAIMVWAVITIFRRAQLLVLFNHSSLGKFQFDKPCCQPLPRQEVVVTFEKIGKDMSKVQSAKEENLLLTAYRAVMGNCEKALLLTAYRAVMGNCEKADPVALVAEYERHFSSVVPHSSTHRHNFKRFSMADSNVRVVVKSNTAIV